MNSNGSSMPKTSWNQLISGLSDPHLLQTSQWATVKSRYGWIPHYLVWEGSAGDWKMSESVTGDFKQVQPAAAGLLLERQVFPGLSVLYMPKGPLLADPGDLAVWEVVLADLEHFARQRGALQLKIDPDVVIGLGVPGEDAARELPGGLAFQERLAERSWIFSREQIQFRNTVLVDLRDDEDALLARMKSKTRYNIRLSGRKGVQVRRGSKDDLGTLYRMYAETSLRGGFTIRGEDYYRTVWMTFFDSPIGVGEGPFAQPLVAEYQGQPVAGAVIFAFGKRAWYLHGMSLPEHSDKMATYLVQWEAMRWARERGCTSYDMWGAPDQFTEDDSLWGVYRFKSGFGGQVSRTIGAWDFPARPIRYTLYTHWLPRLLAGMRWFGNFRTRRLASR